MSALVWLGSHWLLLAIAIAVLVLAVLYPGVAALVARWLIGTQRGRYLLLAGLATWGCLYLRSHYLDVGRAAGLAECKAATDRAAAVATAKALARDTSAQVIGQQAQADTATRIEQGKAATTAAQGRTHARIQAQPAVAGCALPDAGIVSDVQASDARLRAAADRMRRIGTPSAR